MFKYLIVATDLCDFELSATISYEEFINPTFEAKDLGYYCEDKKELKKIISWVKDEEKIKKYDKMFLNKKEDIIDIFTEAEKIGFFKSII
jgi:hypothetical protein